MSEEHPHDDELQPEQTTNYQPGAKKTMDEINKMDEDDEAMRKYKASLGIGTGQAIGDPNDPRTVVMISLSLESPDRPDMVVDLEAPSQAAQDEKVAAMKEKPFVIKEGAQFRMKVKFRVQHEVLSGLKYLQVVKKMGISNKTDEMIGSYSPNTTDKPFHEKKLEAETAPSGMIARGKYTASSKFVDDDGNTHLAFNWSFEIKKDW
ncbi:MAG: hypothetical protein Q9162_005065 [Coniocarpon cinnabarinum]